MSKFNYTYIAKPNATDDEVKSLVALELIKSGLGGINLKDDLNYYLDLFYKNQPIFEKRTELPNLFITDLLDINKNTFVVGIFHKYNGLNLPNNEKIKQTDVKRLSCGIDVGLKQESLSFIHSLKKQLNLTKFDLQINPQIASVYNNNPGYYFYEGGCSAYSHSSSKFTLDFSDISVFIQNSILKNLNQELRDLLTSKTICAVFYNALIFFKTDEYGQLYSTIEGKCKFDLSSFGIEYADTANIKISGDIFKNYSSSTTPLPQPDYILDFCDFDCDFGELSKTALSKLNEVKAERYSELENNMAELPTLPMSRLESSSEGIWDVYYPDENNVPDLKYYYKVPLNRECFGRDPWEKVDANSCVTIDFGTSSTIVAVRNKSRQISLKRMGRFDEQVQMEHFENPTYLLFSNYKEFQKEWLSAPYHPETLNAHIKVSKTAKEESKLHPRSSLSSIKTWSRSDNNSLCRLTDEFNIDFEFTRPKVELDENDIVGDFKNRTIDPIEIYAYYLGIYLNNQSLGNGGAIYLIYYMTFPVEFDKETKARILQGFKRGLTRSLPPSLVYSQKWKEHKNKLRVKEIASEPVALSASFLKGLKIKPTKEGLAFAVFDFGGGTTDFAIGLYRLPTEEEEDDEGWEQVLDILDTGGDNDLGGEHLLNLIAFETVKANLPKILKEHIRFALPHNLTPFDGSETIWGEGSIEYENFAKLKNELIPLWHNGKILDDGSNDEKTTISLHFDVSGDSQKQIVLEINQSHLREIIIDRIKLGVERFLGLIKSAKDVTESNFDEIHLIFSGNSCRSPLTKKVLQDIINNVSEVNGHKLIPENLIKKKENKIIIDDYQTLKDYCSNKDNSLENIELGENIGNLQGIFGDCNRTVADYKGIENWPIFPMIYFEPELATIYFDPELATKTKSLTLNDFKAFMQTKEFAERGNSYESLMDYWCKVRVPENLVKYAISFLDPKFVQSEQCNEDFVAEDTVQEFEDPLLTLKTGVALGLQELLPGECTGYKERNRSAEIAGQAPFKFYVGKTKQGKLSISLFKNHIYGIWAVLDNVKKSCVTKLSYTTDPRVENSDAEVELLEMRIEHEESTIGKTIFIRAIGPDTIEWTVSNNPEAPEENCITEVITFR